MSVSVKAQDVSDLNETQKNLYNTLLASQAEQTDQIHEASADEADAQTREADDTTLDAAKQSTEDQNVVTSDGTAVENNNSDTKSSTVTYLFDVTLKHGDEAVEPTGEVQVSIQSALFKNTDSDISVIHLDEVKNEAVDTDAIIDTDEGTAVLTTESFSTFVVTDSKEKQYTGDWSGFVNLSKDAGKTYTFTLDQNYSTDKVLNVGNNVSVVIDLNGHNLTYTGDADSFLTVSDTGHLTVKDNSFKDEQQSNSNVTKSTAEDQTNKYNNDGGATNALLEYSSDSSQFKLTYYVTESTASETTDSDGVKSPGTSETLQKYEVTTSGWIKSSDGSKHVLNCTSGGTLDIQGGLLTTAYSSNGQVSIVNNNGGTVNMSGGYISAYYGNDDVKGRQSNCNGVGFYSDGGTSTMTGGVIAGNRTWNGGAGVYLTGSSTIFNLDGGTISGNTVHREQGSYGGGVLVDNSATLNIQNGYITNNAYTGTVSTGSSEHGGGGISAKNKATVNMSGGYVTGNYSQEAGGGMYIGYYGNNSYATFNMTGGTVASNCAYQGEGGGIRISGYSTGLINTSDVTKKIYISNNKITNGTDWGGGGIFVQANGQLNIVNVLIANNSAGGYGGGVAACPTGDVNLNMGYMALYDNTAAGTSMSGGTGGKNDDTASKDIVGTNPNYATDFYCVAYNQDANNKSVNHNLNDNIIATITTGMLGLGQSNWSGVITTGKDTVNYYKQNSSISVPDWTKNKLDYSSRVQSDYVSSEINATHLAALKSNPSNNDKNKAVNSANVVISGNSSNTHGGGIMTNGYVGTSFNTSNESFPVLSASGSKGFKYAGTDYEISISENEFKFDLLTKEPIYDKNSNSWYYSSTDSANRVAVAEGTEGYLAQGTTDSNGNFSIAYCNLSFLAGKATEADNGTGTITLYLIEEIGNASDVTYDHTIYKFELPYRLVRTQRTLNGGGTTSTIYYLNYTLISDDTHQPKFSKINYNDDGSTTETEITNGDSSAFLTYTTSTATGGSNDSSITFNKETFSNTATPVNVKIFKHISNQDTALSGAEFQLYKTYSNGTYNDQVTSIGAETNSYTVTSGNDGYADLGNLAPGTYYLKETNAPAGYAKLKEPIQITITRNIAEDGTVTKTVTYKSVSGSENATTANIPEGQTYYQVDVGNYSGTKLPDTGGIGTDWFILGGCGLISIALIYALLMHSRREGGDLG